MSGILCRVCGLWSDLSDDWKCPHVDAPAHVVARLTDERDRAIRERDVALEQRRIALAAARKAKKDAHDATIGLIDLLRRAEQHITGDAAALAVRREVTEVIFEQDPDGEARTYVESLRNEAGVLRANLLAAGFLDEDFREIVNVVDERDVLKRYVGELEEKLAIVPLTAAVMAVDDTTQDYAMLCGVLERALAFIAAFDGQINGARENVAHAKLIGDVSEMLAYFTEMSKKPPAS